MGLADAAFPFRLPKTGDSGRDPAWCGAFVTAHIRLGMLRIPKGRAPRPTDRYRVFGFLFVI
jgi:hypothetical protein